MPPSCHRHFCRCRLCRCPLIQVRPVPDARDGRTVTRSPRPPPYFPGKMVLNVFHDSGQGAYFVLLVVCGVICTATIALRFASTRLSGRKPGLEDWLAFAAAAIFLVRVGVAISGML